MARYRTKSAIEAMRFTNETKDQVFNWVRGQKSAIRVDGKPALLIGTLKGDMVATLGDWIIKGVNGEFYPCKPDIFEKTYEPADEPLNEVMLG